MADSLILCGGTGAHAGVAFLRLHTLGFALGFFHPEGAGDHPFNFPKLYLVDQDSGDGDEREPTAWQLARQLRDRHPGRFDWLTAIGRQEPPAMIDVTPLPIGADKGWFKPPNNALGQRFEASPWLPVIASARQRRIDYSKGMMGSPAIGSLLFKLKQFDERNKDLNRDETFGDLVAEQGRLVVAGSGVGGTGAAVGPTLAQLLAARGGARVMAVMILNWFAFEENEAEDERREKAQLRNRIMRENANSALEFYGQSLAQTVAAVPVGMPSRSFLKRRYTADVGQPVRESFIHAVAALCAERHFLHGEPYGPGLYAMGAIDRGRLDGATAIPGGTLQGLANQAATLADVLDAWQRVLRAPQAGRVRPAIYEAVAAAAEPARVADFLAGEIAHYREQIAWMKDVLAIDGMPAQAFTREAEVRGRMLGEGGRFELAAGTPPEQIPAALLLWTARWIREAAAERGTAIGLATPAGEATAAQWPDYNAEGIGVAVRASGDLTRVPNHNIAAVLSGFVDRSKLSTNGWPHPLAAADFFRHAVDRRDPAAMRQLELLLLGMMTGRLAVRPLDMPAAVERAISLEYLGAELRRRGFTGLAEHGLYDREGAGLLVGFTSPYTLLCPVPFMDDDDDNRLWQSLWTALSGSRSGELWSRAPAPASWGENDGEIGKLRAWIDEQKRLFGGTAPAWTRAFEGFAGAGDAAIYGRGARVQVFWGEAASGARTLAEVDLPTASDAGIWAPPPGTAELPEADLLAAVPEVARLLDDGGEELYSPVEFEKPGAAGAVRGFWEEHLSLLRERRKIYNWSRTERGEVLIAIAGTGPCGRPCSRAPRSCRAPRSASRAASPSRSDRCRARRHRRATPAVRTSRCARSTWTSRCRRRARSSARRSARERTCVPSSAGPTFATTPWGGWWSAGACGCAAAATR